MVATILWNFGIVADRLNMKLLRQNAADGQESLLFRAPSQMFMKVQFANSKVHAVSGDNAAGEAFLDLKIHAYGSGRNSQDHAQNPVLMTSHEPIPT